MAYEIGTFIDLSPKKKDVQSTASKLWDVGTKVVFVKLFPSIETNILLPS